MAGSNQTYVCEYLECAALRPRRGPGVCVSNSWAYVQLNVQVSTPPLLVLSVSGHALAYWGIVAYHTCAHNDHFYYIKRCTPSLAGPRRDLVLPAASLAALFSLVVVSRFDTALARVYVVPQHFSTSPIDVVGRDWSEIHSEHLLE